MSMPIGCLEIIQYWEFSDFPRYILARDEKGMFWVFEGSFDDDLDDYPDHFIVCRVGRDATEAMDKFKARAAIPLGTDRSKFDAISLNRIRFDETNRKQLHVGAQ